MSSPIRALNDEGLRQFQTWLINGAVGPLPNAILTDLSTSVPVDEADSINKRSFTSRFEIGDYLNTALARCETADMRSNDGLWAWLTLFYFDALCPPDGVGKRKLLAIDHYMPSREWSRYYRHLIRSAVLLVHDYGALAKCLLISPRGGIKHTDFLEQLGSRQEFISNHSLIEVAHRFYFNTKKQMFQRGATDRKKPGSLRRFVAVIQQLEMTYDLHAMNVAAIMTRLPSEFDSWRA